MRDNRLLIAAKALAGVSLGVALWWSCAAPYNELLCGLAEPLLRSTERSPVTRLRPVNGEIAIDRIDFRRGSARPALATGHLTANIILLTALFATNRRPMSVRNLASFALAAMILVAIHILAVIANVKSIYAFDLGDWSARNYGPAARTFWESATNFYTLAGAFGSAFLLWWLMRPSAPHSGARPQAASR